MEIPSHSYGVSLAVWDHTVLPATRHKRTHPASTPARQAGTRFTDRLRMEGWVSSGPGCKEQLAHGCYLVVKRLGIEPAPCRTQVRRRNHYTTKPPSWTWGHCELNMRLLWWLVAVRWWHITVVAVHRRSGFVHTGPSIVAECNSWPVINQLVGWWASRLIDIACALWFDCNWYMWHLFNLLISLINPGHHCLYILGIIDCAY